MWRADPEKTSKDSRDPSNPTAIVDHGAGTVAGKRWIREAVALKLLRKPYYGARMTPTGRAAGKNAGLGSHLHCRAKGNSSN